MAGSNCRLPRCQRKQDTLLNFPKSSHNLPYDNNLLPYSKERNLPRFPENSYIFLAILVPILGAQKDIVNHENAIRFITLSLFVFISLKDYNQNGKCHE